MASQLQLFALEPAATHAKWIGHRGPWGRNLTWTRDDLPGVMVRHCGHGTALYPYYITTGDNRSPADERTYGSLAECQAAAVGYWTTHAAIA